MLAPNHVARETWPEILARKGLITAGCLAMYRRRDRIFGRIGEVQWRILLEIAANGPCSVTSACHASGWPATTGLRHVAALELAGLIKRTPHPSDRRSDIVSLTDVARTKLAEFETPAKA
jgi:DNA-binding MarR family transcriptional regulator